MSIQDLALDRAQAGLTVPLDSLIAAILLAAVSEQYGPVKLARAPGAYTYVGGSIPGAQRAIGYWSGGAERSSLVPLPTGADVRKLSLALAARNHQKTAVWFQPGEGNDVLHVLRVKGDPKGIRARLNKHGVSYMTIVPSNGSSLVHVVDQGNELGAAVRAFAAESGAQYDPVQGSAGYAELPTKLARRDTDPRARKQELNSFLHAIHYGGYQESDRLPFADWLREVTGNPDDPRAHVVQNHAAPNLIDTPNEGYYGINVNAPLYATAKNRPSGLLLSFIHPRMHYNGPVDGTTVANYARVQWSVPHPGSRNPGADRIFRTLMDRDQLHDFIDKLPQPHQAEWRTHAANHGMLDNRGKV